MKRTLLIMTMLVGLAFPLMAGADETVIPPEASWTPTPPARSHIDNGQLAQLLREQGLISARDYSQLTQPQGSLPAPEGHIRVWTWEEIDHNPAVRIGGSGGE
jgi:hypothetical protein